MGICQRVLLLCVLLPVLMQPARAVEVGLFTDTDKFETIKLSPTGEYYAITVPLARRCSRYGAVRTIRWSDRSAWAPAPMFTASGG